MGSKGVVFFVMGLMVFCSLMSSTHGRKVLMVEETMVPSREERLYLTALPKGKVPPSTPSKKGHAATIDDKLIGRILRSVPSPGVGH